MLPRNARKIYLLFHEILINSNHNKRCHQWAVILGINFVSYSAILSNNRVIFYSLVHTVQYNFKSINFYRYTDIQTT